MNTAVRMKALEANRRKRAAYLANIAVRVSPLKDLADHDDIAKIILAMLYWCEGSKNKGHISFGNSDHAIIHIFLKTMRQCYSINEKRFRVTVQCRADQNTNQLEKYWHRITKIPRHQFYKTRIDPRSVGKPTQKPEYKGVCRIDYFSADIYNELAAISALIMGR